MDASLPPTKERLMRAAISTFARKGYKAATVREICSKAGVKNIYSINYYFGGKASLYKQIVELMFAAHAKHLPEINPGASPLDHFKNYILSYCMMLYSGDELARDTIRIFTAEMAQPSDFLSKLVERHTKPQTLSFMQTVGEMLGPDVPESIVRDTCISIGSQIIYYSYAWPVVSAVFPDHPGMPSYHRQLADHIIRFSIGGIQSIKQYYSDSERAHK